MSVPATRASTDVAVPSEAFAEGLEDVEDTDLSVPRLQINHTEARFVDSLSNEEWSDLTVVLLGLVKQRILWDADVEDGDKPLCKSLDHKAGLPEPASFPWKEAGFTRTEFDLDAPELDCEGCKLKDWGSHPKRDTAWCTEQFVFPLLICNEDDSTMPAIFTAQRSAIKPAKNYITGFARTKSPLFTVHTRMSLKAESRGSVKYAVPKFIKEGPTEEAAWPSMAAQYRSIREFITAPRTRRVPEADSGTAAPPAARAPATVEEEEPF